MAPPPKGAGKLATNMLPPKIYAVHKDCAFFNHVGGRSGMTMNCDLDHLGKRNRARGKIMTGSAVGNYCFDEVQLSKWSGYLQVVDSASKVEKLLNHDGNIYVYQMVCYIKAVKKNGTKLFDELTNRFRIRADVDDKYRALKLYGELKGCLTVLIVRHHGEIDKEGTHMSVTETL